MLNSIYVLFNLRNTVMGDIEDIFLNVLLRKTKPTFLGIIYRPTKRIDYSECFDKHLDDINLDNEIFHLGNFNMNFSHSGKLILKRNWAMQSPITSKSLVKQYNSFS